MFTDFPVYLTLKGRAWEAVREIPATEFDENNGHKEMIQKSWALSENC